MRRLFLAALAGCVSVSALISGQEPAPSRMAAGDRTPKLLVLLSVDQMRADYIDKFHRQWSRGLRRLVTDGAWFRQVDYPYFNTVTCVGHSSISTGAVPSVHGMILNAWWDRGAGRQVTCTDDDRATIISYGKPVSASGESAIRMLAPALADELRAQLSPAGRTIAFSLKARSTVTLGGHRPDAIAWFDDSGAWVTSTAFSPRPVPEVADFITRNPVEKDFGKVWDRSLPKRSYLYEDPAIGAHPTKGLTSAFPHALSGAGAAPDRTFYDQWQSSPFADEFLAKMALDVADHMKLATAGGRTNMIAISFSSLDKVGHDFGPNSHEIQDILIRLDRTLGDFLAGLDHLAGPGRYTVALTADHGVAPLPERAQAEGLDAGRIREANVTSAAERVLTNAFGPGPWVNRVIFTELYLRKGAYEKLRTEPAVLADVRAAISHVPGVLTVYTRDELAAGRFDGDPIGRQLARGYFADRSGDLAVVPKPYWMLQVDGTTHGTGYGYDTHVPLLLLGAGIAKGEYLAPASPIDVAPTLAFLAGITLPRAQGRALTEALAKESLPRPETRARPRHVARRSPRARTGPGRAPSPTPST
ncbi:MAG: alkaline phosphatase family protein [Acidobacteria bacterium]|nr:alkaline phosphatase family protein [Acidobacteriota bacterium]